MHTPRKKVLIISYYFPPSGGPGVQRVLKFVKYLREFGWEPVVLTVSDADYPVRDDSLFAEIPAGVRVYRSRILEPYRLYRMLTGRKRDESVDIATVGMNEHERKKISERLSEWLRACFFVPDARVLWLPFAIRLGRKIIREEKIDILLSSAPPYTTHLIGLKLHRCSGLPWVADFRDSWIGWVSAPQWRPGASRAIEKKMERAVLAEADRVLTVSNGVKEDLLSRQPELDDARWRLLLNGFDAADFADVKLKTKPDKLTITYLGSLYGSRNPDSLLQAVELLQEAGDASVNKITFRFVGRISAPIIERIKSSPAAAMFELVPYVPHEESVSYLLASDVLLLIIDDTPASRGILTGKLFEYIGAGKPILALAPDGEAASLILQHKLGWVAPPNDVQKIKQTLLTITEAGTDSGGNQLNEAMRKQFERKEQTRQLAAIMDELHAARGRVPA